MARTKNLTLKLLMGLPRIEQTLVAQFGDAAATKGARLARRFNFALEMCDKQLASETGTQILEAVRTGDATLLREIVAFMDAVRTGPDSPMASAFARTASFICFCTSDIPVPKSIAADLAQSPAMRLALERARPFIPTINEVADYVSDTMEEGEDLPDHKTISRWCKILGIPTRRYSRKAN